VLGEPALPPARLAPVTSRHSSRVAVRSSRQS
jgi:hypothetical protein